MQTGVPWLHWAAVQGLPATKLRILEGFHHLTCLYILSGSVTNGVFCSSSSLKARATSQQTWVPMRSFHTGKISGTKLTKLIFSACNWRGLLKSEFHAISCLRVHESLQYHSVCKANPLLNFRKFKTPSKPCDGFPLLCVTNNAPVYLWEAWKRHKSKASNFLMFIVYIGDSLFKYTAMSIESDIDILMISY